MKRLQIIILALLVSSFVLADGIKRPTSFNYLRGSEALMAEKYEEAMHYLNLELNENPKNGYAWALIMAVQYENEDYSEVLNSGQKALRLIPKKDKEYQAIVHATLSKVYFCLDLRDKAFEEITTAIEVNPDELDLLRMRAELHYQFQQYEQSNADFRNLLDKNPAETTGYIGMGRNLFEQKRYAEAIAKFSQAIKMEEDFSQAYAFRADCYSGNGDYILAAHDYAKALEIDFNTRAFANMQEVNDTCYRHLAVLLKVNYLKDKDGKWLYSLGCLHQSHNHYQEAIEEFKTLANTDESVDVYESLAKCYGELGDYNAALKYVDLGLTHDSTDIFMMIEKSNYLYNLGQTTEALAQMDKVVEAYPDNFYAYYSRGFLKDNVRDADGAIKDYTICLTLEPEFAYAYLTRGDMYMLKHDTVSATNDYRAAVERDTIITDEGNCKQYALAALGLKDSASIYMQKILDKYPTSGNYYDAACLMSRMNEKVSALEYLEKAMEKGFREFKHMELDDDMDNIREEQSYKLLVQKFEKTIKLEEVEEEMATSDRNEEPEITAIPFKKDGSMMKIQCTINDLPLHFIFDTGASDVSISDVEANFMMKNGYLSKSDIIGKQNYSVADGSLHEGTVINLKQVRFGDLELKNVRASVVKSQRAPLLLGQSVFSRLGKIEIDNNEKIVKVTRINN